MVREDVMLTLGEVIEHLSEYDRSYMIEDGFYNPHSYRGYYDRLAFEPKKRVSIGEMIDSCKSAIGSVYEGYKGGEYIMSENSACYLAMYGSTGAELTTELLDYLITKRASFKQFEYGQHIQYKMFDEWTEGVYIAKHPTSNDHFILTVDDRIVWSENLRRPEDVLYLSLSEAVEELKKIKGKDIVIKS